MKRPNQPEVFITLKAIKKIECFVRQAPGEVNGLGIVEERGNDLIVIDAFTLPEEVSPGSADYTDAFNDFLTDFAVNGGDPAKLRFQWHSHGNIPAFFSPEDLETIENCLGDYRISLVVNKEKQYLCRLDIFKPLRLTFFMPLRVILPKLPVISIEKETIKECEEEMTRNVRGINFLERILEKVEQKITGDDDSIDYLAGKIAVPYEYLVFEEEADELPETT